MSRRLHLPLALLFGLVVRVPFWIEALRTPVDGDTAIIGLMARHLGRGTTMWGQPYGSPLEAWLAAPFVAALGPTAAALRLCYFLLGLGLGSALGGRLSLLRAGPLALFGAFELAIGAFGAASLRLFRAVGDATLGLANQIEGDTGNILTAAVTADHLAHCIDQHLSAQAC